MVTRKRPNVVHMLPVLLKSVVTWTPWGTKHARSLHINSNSFGKLSVSQKIASPVGLVVPCIQINSKSSSLTYKKCGCNCQCTLEAAFNLLHLDPQLQTPTWPKNFYKSILISLSNHLVYSAYVQPLFSCPFFDIPVWNWCLPSVWDSRPNCWQHIKLSVMTIQHIWCPKDTDRTTKTPAHVIITLLISNVFCHVKITCDSETPEETDGQKLPASASPFTDVTSSFLATTALQNISTPG